MRLTKKKAVEITKELWEWCAKTGEDKEQWPRWKEYGDFDADCPLCEYTGRYTFGRCRYCPLQGMWTPTSGSDCANTGSPYLMWDTSHNKKDRKKYAQQIVDLCDRWLKENHGKAS